MAYGKVLQEIANKKLHPIYCLYGAETYLMDQLIKALQEVIVDSAYADFNEQILDGTKLLIDDAVNAFETLPFFSERRLVVVRQVPWFGTTKNSLSEADEEKLMTYLENPCPSTVVVLLCDGVDKRKKAGKLLQKNGMLFELGKLDETELKKILMGKLNQLGCRISSENLQLCIYLLGYLEKDSDRDLYEILSQVERVASASNGEIDKALLSRMLEKPLDTNIFAYMDAISDGKTLEAVRIKQQLLSEDFNEIQINAMLFKHFRNLYKTYLWLNKGYNATVIAEKIGVHPFSAKKYASQCRHFKEQYLKQVVIDLAELDYRMKTGRIGFEQALDLMTVCLSQKVKIPLE